MRFPEIADDQRVHVSRKVSLIIPIPKLHRKLLPSLPVSARAKLPAKPGCYYVFRGWNLLYIGRAETSMKSRWSGHHQLRMLHGHDRIHYWRMPAVLVRDRESQDITRFRPPLNHRMEPRDWRGRVVWMAIDLGIWAVMLGIAWMVWRR